MDIVRRCLRVSERSFAVDLMLSSRALAVARRARMRLWLAWCLATGWLSDGVEQQRGFALTLFEALVHVVVGGYELVGCGQGWIVSSDRVDESVERPFHPLIASLENTEHGSIDRINSCTAQERGVACRTMHW